MYPNCYYIYGEVDFLGEPLGLGVTGGEVCRMGIIGGTLTGVGLGGLDVADALGRGGTG
jgi:hypothetical protein